MKFLLASTEYSVVYYSAAPFDDYPNSVASAMEAYCRAVPDVIKYYDYSSSFPSFASLAIKGRMGHVGE